MKVYLIRHSEPDYSQVDSANLVGHGRDLSHLSERGIALAETTSHNPIFEKVQIIVSSPYTRALQTAAELIKNNHIPLQVELGLMEWQPDKSGKLLKSASDAELAHREFLKNNGKSNPNYPLPYESRSEIIERVNAIFAEYSRNYSCIACVTHGVVIRQFLNLENINYCEIHEYEYIK
ncbi:histidine phosphatase family protein [Companilactobacillus ginsenosidimutans]|uniref:Phosphoglycerate mutase n=1 Tax=Companilactobacillus ginsenosidimutans TaxID=1007676 RepID=A0A0H4QIQ1_9LACO|nr:histidine phosphatase family protein [Companilactobacillus ginsenosidimutans]AKP68309.1 hypothetical protein ABM34_12680 [Companilactobacillus ginsenosidimutans]